MTDEIHKLGEVLRSAREAKGVDLARVERDTKIRARYLSALERAEYRELPGAVYTRGFLRNYGLYLGLDPEYLVDLYRLETSAAVVERPAVPAPPRPIARRRTRALVVTPGALLAVLLTVGVAAFIGYLTWEFVNFARTPALDVTRPPGDVASHPQTTITVQGRTEPNARITVQGLRENPTVTADAEGRFTLSVELVPGSNVITLTAFDPVTKRDSAPISRTIRVVTEPSASPTAGVISLGLGEPVADASLPGPISIAGTATPGTPIEVAATLIQPAPLSFSVADPAGAPVNISPQQAAARAPLALTAADDGAFGGMLDLAPPGTWELRVAASGVEPITRRLTITPTTGLSGTLRVQGGDSYLEVEQDGAAVEPVSGGIVDPGESVTLAATTELRIRAGNAAAVLLTINGVEIGAMGGLGEVVEWRITRSGS